MNEKEKSPRFCQKPFFTYKLSYKPANKSHIKNYFAIQKLTFLFCLQCYIFRYYSSKQFTKNEFDE